MKVKNKQDFASSEISDNIDEENMEDVANVFENTLVNGKEEPIAQDDKNLKKKDKRKKSKESAELQAAIEENEKLKDRLLRLQADFDNYRKRIARDHVDMIKRSNEDLIDSLLPVLDNFDSASQMVGENADESLKAYLQGFQIVQGELVKVLENNGLKAIEALGSEFDANLHDALTTAPASDGRAGIVVSEFRKGYTLNGRVLRASQVVVSAAAEENTGNIAEDSASQSEDVSAAFEE
ncbi:MAG: nucleotide exchange factor GrpE [Lentisphaerae bacterium]|jgi:molecular chaperone GrpE|nr:nucleotide exchange factor GrpE [Lentisphaerota bacterium]